MAARVRIPYGLRRNPRSEALCGVPLLVSALCCQWRANALIGESWRRGDGKQRYASRTVRGGKRAAQRVLANGDGGRARPRRPCVASRHSSAGTRPGGQVGMGRGQSRRGDEPTARPAVGDQATLRTRPRSCAAASDGVIAGAGLFPGARRRNRGKTLGARGPSVARRRSRQRNRADRTWSRDGTIRPRREGHQDSRRPPNRSRRWNRGHRWCPRVADDRTCRHVSRQPDGRLVRVQQRG